ncbi:hypothetical protein [Gimesia panareensis]|uniref:Uncharacterized protein n=1 Tax=Gimesia panareensis TaxID=2527978 RepID=A0A518A8A9_9PLAN|nr:hypothetical protein [Gimesia panareensis]QDT28102.1 hypothetical protein Enr10x_34410 [Gimesia panareensis]QDU50968.1 hypothetical protein Pan110_33290 [Gimesia panareensis]
MSTGFAGSRSKDERRRRRLASECSESLDNANDDSDSPRLARTHRFAAGQFPLRTMIFPRRWKLALYYLPVLLCFSGLIAADYYRAELPAEGATLSRFLSLKQSPLLPLLGGALLFVTGQTALLIASLRTQSLHDFSGRYRLWKWIASGLFLFALCQTTRLHTIWAQTVIDLRLFDWGTHTQLLAWLVPTLAFGCTVALMAYLEMRGDRAGLNMLILAGSAYVLSLTFQFTENLIPGEAWHHLIDAGLLYFAHWCLFTSLLLHTHHLLYRSVDLPEKEPSRLKDATSGYLYRRRIKRKARRVAKALQRKQRLLEKEQAQQEREAQKQAEQERRELERAEQEKVKQQQAAEAAEKKKAKEEAAAQAKAAKQEKELFETPPLPVEEPEPAAEKTSPEPQSEQPASSQPGSRKGTKTVKKKTRVDLNHDPELLKGLSKRERRKLQKQWREEERRLAAQEAEDWE